MWWGLISSSASCPVFVSGIHLHRLLIFTVGFDPTASPLRICYLSATTLVKQVKQGKRPQNEYLIVNTLSEQSVCSQGLGGVFVSQIDALLRCESTYQGRNFTSRQDCHLCLFRTASKMIMLLTHRWHDDKLVASKESKVSWKDSAWSKRNVFSFPADQQRGNKSDTG